jgi:glutamyl-tRNA reductase
MSITFDIPADVQAEVEGIPDLNLRVALFLRHEAQLEKVRRQRHSAQAREIVGEAVRQAEIEKAAGFDAAESFSQLRQAHQDITERL